MQHVIIVIDSLVSGGILSKDQTVHYADVADAIEICDRSSLH